MGKFANIWETMLKIVPKEGMLKVEKHENLFLKKWKKAGKISRNGKFVSVLFKTNSWREWDRCGGAQKPF